MAEALERVKRMGSGRNSAVWVVLGLLLASCGSDDFRVGEPASECSATGSGDCSCSDGTTGVAECDAEGLLLHCACDSAAGGAAALPSESGGAATVLGGAGAEAAASSSFECLGVPLSDRAEYLTEDDAACAGILLEPQPVPLDVYLLLDRSVSMTYEDANDVVRWDAVQVGINRIIELADTSATRLGLGVFSLDGGDDEATNCSADGYAVPAVPMEAPAVSGPAILSFLETTLVDGLTPTQPALEGALEVARAHQENNPDRETVVLLITDGFPTLCIGEDPVAELEQTALAGLTASPSIRTFVLGIEAGFNLDPVAWAGGTSTAFDVPEGGDVAAALPEAFSALQTTERACSFDLPEPDDAVEPVDTETILVQYDAASGERFEIPALASEESCGSNSFGGWYFPAPDTHPWRVGLCPCSCASRGGKALEFTAECGASFFF